MYKNHNDKGKYGNFPDPFAHYGKKSTKAYGKKYAKAIEKQWGTLMMKEVSLEED